MSGKDVNQAMQDLMNDAMRRSQEAVVDVMRNWRSQWESTSASLPEGMDGLPAMPPVATPEQIDAAFDFAERMLADQRRFTKELLKVTTPPTGSAGGTQASGNKATS